MNRLLNRVAIITGGAQGVGRGLALAMAKEGAHIAIVDINEETIAKTVTELEGIGVKSVGITCNVGVRDQVNEAVERVIATFGRVDILVNNAQASRNKLLETITDEDLDLAINSGAKSSLYFMQAVFPFFKDQHYGKVINFASGAGISGQFTQGAYAMAKEAVRGLSRVAATEWGQYGINVNVICPFANSPGMLAWAEHFPEQYENSMSKVPLRRLGDCEDDVGRTAVFLASSDSDYITGQTIMVDGGGVMVR